MNSQPIPQDRAIYIAKYPTECTVEELRQIFSKLGNVETVQLNQNGKGAFIVFDNHDTVQKALSEQVTINNTVISVNQYIDIDKLDAEANVFIDNLDPKENQSTLKKLLSPYGEILSLKVHMSDKAGVAYIQFDKREAADKCIADQQKLGLKIIKYAQKKKLSQRKDQQQGYARPSPSDKELEANLFTKNLKMTVTEEQLKNAYLTIVPIENVKLIQPKAVTQIPQHKPLTQAAHLYFKTAEDGKKAIDQALRTPQIFELYEKGTVLISLLLSPNELFNFNQMKKNQQNMILQQKYQQQYAYQQMPMQYPNGGNPMRWQKGGYPPHQQMPPQNRNRYPQNRQVKLPPVEQLEDMVSRGQGKEVNDIIGPLLFQRVDRVVGPQNAPYVTGILLTFDNYSVKEQLKFLSDDAYLNENIKQAMELLNKSQHK